MFQFAFVALLFQFRARKPQLSPLLQFPNRRQTPVNVCFGSFLQSPSQPPVALLPPSIPKAGILPYPGTVLKWAG